jgi:exonuclease SbcC
MKILSHKLTNVGPHAKLDVDLGSNLFGVIGANGSGKSVLLNTLRYVVANEFSEASRKASSYIKDLDPKGKAVIETVLESPQGELVEIVKTIKHSSTERTLRIGDEPIITAAKKVDERLASMFGADPSTLGRLVFISQGTLAHLLGSIGSEREKLFMRVLDADYMRAASGHVKSRVQLLKAGAINYMPLLESSVAAYTQTQTQLEETNDKLKVLDEEGVVAKHTLLTEIETLATGMIYFSKRRAALSQENSILGSTLGPDIDADNSKRKELDGQKAQLTSAKLSHSLAATAAKLKAEQKEYTDGIVQAHTDLFALPDLQTLCPIGEVIVAEWDKAGLAATVNWDGNLHEYCVTSKEVDRLKKSVDDLKDDAGKISKVEEELERLVDRIALLKEVRAFRLSNKAGCDCPFCESQVDSERLQWTDKQEANLTELTNAAAVYKGAIAEHSQALKTLTEKWFKKRTDLERISNYPGVKLFKRFVNIDDFEELKSDNPIAVARKEAAQYSAMKGARDFYDKKIKSLTEKLEWTNKALREIPDIKAEGTSVEELDKGIAKIDEELQQLTNAQKVRHTTLTTIERNTREIQNLEHERKGDSEKLDAKIAELDLPDFSLDRVSDIALDFSDRKAEYQELQASKRALTARLVALAKEVADYEDKVRKGEKKISFIAGLERLSAKLDEIPKLYIRRQFEYITDAVSDILASLDTTYEIRPSATVPLTFDFRMMKPNSVWLPQDYLSGGQKVRLSLAFLIAVQRTLLPNIGLLVLDEPSLHLDDESKRQLSELLGKLSETLFAGNSQIIVCDHDKKVLENCGNILHIESK